MTKCVLWSRLLGAIFLILIVFRVANGDVPYSFPHFSYLKDGEVVVETTGYTRGMWYSDHIAIIEKLLGGLEGNS